MSKVISDLDKLKVKFKKAKRRYRQEKYQLFAETMKMVVELSSDKGALAAFAKHAGMNELKFQRDKSSLANAVFTYVVGSEQLGWKGARAAEFLHHFKKVPLDKLADAFRKYGGIEKVVALAAKEDPRRPPSSGRKADAARRKHPKVTKDEVPGHDDDWGEPIDDDGEQEPGDDDASKNGDELSEVTVRLTAALLAKLQAARPGRRVKLVGVRPPSVGRSTHELDIEEVRRLNTD